MKKMKKFTLLLIGLLVFYSCLNNDNDTPNFSFEYLPIDSVITPASFIFGETDTITVKYTLPNSCYEFRNIYYEYKDTTRIVAINTFLDLSNSICEKNLIQKEYKIAVLAEQEEDYLFKFWKGTDDNGKNIFEEVIVPVN
jgi:hypothetical protein